MVDPQQIQADCFLVIGQGIAHEHACVTMDKQKQQAKQCAGILDIQLLRLGKHPYDRLQFLCANKLGNALTGKHV